MTYGNADFVPIVLGTSTNAYNMARSLHEAFGVRTLALGRSRPRETANSAIIDVRAYRAFDDPAFIVATLLEVAQEFKGRPLLLMPNIEFYTTVVLENRDVLSQHFIIPLVDTSLAQRLMHKASFAQICAEFNIPHPATRVLHAGEIPADFGTDLPFGFPVILKPANTDIYPRRSFEGKKKVYVVSAAAQLREIASRIFAAGYDDDLIIQEYIEGDESVMKVANTYSDHHGRMRFLSVAQIALGEPDPTLVGNYNAVITTLDHELTESIRSLLDGIGYTGPANFDVMFDRRTGTSMILELNLRPGAASFATMAAGGNLIRNYVDDLVYGRELPDVVTSDERLWLNVPYPLALAYTATSLRPRLRAAARGGRTHTLHYRADRAPARLLELARISVRQVMNFVKYAGSPLAK